MADGLKTLSLEDGFAAVNTAFEGGRFGDAEMAGLALLDAFPGDANLWNLMGVIARSSGRLAEAVQRYRRGLALAPGNAALWSNLGNALKDLKHCESAVACHRRALDIEPGAVTTLHNLGIALTAAGDDAGAIEAYDAALAASPGHTGVLWDRALSRLRINRFAEGWPDYEARFGREDMPRRAFPGRRWNGQSYQGKRLLVTQEQGLGDGLWVARYLKGAKALGGEMIVECLPPARRLLEAMGVADRVVVQGEELPDADFHIPQCSLPGLFTLEENAIDGAPYIAADPVQRARLNRMTAAAGKKFKLGIVWGGAADYRNRGDRDAALAHFLRHFDLPGVQLFGLQKGPQGADLKALPGAPIIDLSPHTADLFETAAAVAELDLVVMTDTAVAHLAGAMGKPVWVMLCKVPHWMWQHHRSDSPWYPSMRLFRQRTWGDWTGAFDAAAAALYKLLAAHSG